MDGRTPFFLFFPQTRPRETCPSLDPPDNEYGKVNEKEYLEIGRSATQHTGSGMVDVHTDDEQQRAGHLFSFCEFLKESEQTRALRAYLTVTLVQRRRVLRWHCKHSLLRIEER